MKTKRYKASMLATVIIILGIIIFVGLSVSLVSIRERTASIGSGKSNSAFQAADTGVENVLKDITGSNKAKIGELLDCDQISGLINEKNGAYSVELKDREGKKMHCFNDGAKSLFEIKSIKSTGADSSSSQKRAIEAAVIMKGNLRVESGKGEAKTCSGVALMDGEICDAGSFYFDVNFDKPFRFPPNVIATPLRISFSEGNPSCRLGYTTDKIYVQVISITENGFRLFCSGSPQTGTCDPYSHRRSKGSCSWMAIGM